MSASPSTTPAEAVAELHAEIERLRAENEKLRALTTAVQRWAGDSDGSPNDPSDADLLKALWTHEGDRTKPCPGCDGDCGELCAPCTVAQAHAALDAWSDQWRRKHGIKQENPHGA